MNPDPEIREILTLYLLGGGVESYKRDSQVKINKAIEALSQLIERERWKAFLAGFDQSEEGNNGEYSIHDDVEARLKKSFDELGGEENE